jgi:L-aspartate oxidase
MGGIVADLDARSTVAGLYAVGESSCTGLHGANRLASNSLSECFVFARRAIAHVLSEDTPELRRAGAGEIAALRALPAPAFASASTRAALWQDAGIVRSQEGLTRLLDDPHPLARLIARCALERTESRGAHVRVEYPERDPSLDRRHVVIGDEESISWQTWS